MRKIYASSLLGIIVILLLAALGSHIGIFSTHAGQGDDTDTDESAPQYGEYAAIGALALQTAPTNYKVSSSTPQFVLLSFDGSKSVDMLHETLAFTRQMQSESILLHFTYFINAAYFLTKDTSSAYTGPKTSRGLSSIGFSNSRDSIALRVAGFNTAFAEGNEIGSHSAGHFDGGTWSRDEWSQEFTSFKNLLAVIAKNNPGLVTDTPIFLDHIIGFRAPNLSVNSHLYQVLAENNFSYDSSEVGVPWRWPHKDAGGVWHIPLGIIYLGDVKKPIAAMDYNAWYTQSGAKDVVKKGTPQWQKDYDETLAAYRAYFDANYMGTKAPVVIGGHFSKWNDGVYWEAMKAFAKEECGKPQVRCSTYSEFIQYLNTTGVPSVH